MISGIERDLSNPNLRRRIKDNLSKEQRGFIKEVKEEFPKRDLRVRFEDKGHRFVIADGQTEIFRILSFIEKLLLILQKKTKQQLCCGLPEGWTGEISVKNNTSL